MFRLSINKILLKPDYKYVYVQTELIMIAQSARAPERKSVVVDSNPTHANFLLFLVKIL